MVIMYRKLVLRFCMINTIEQKLGCNNALLVKDSHKPCQILTEKLLNMSTHNIQMHFIMR